MDDSGAPLINFYLCTIEVVKMTLRLSMLNQ